MALIAQGVSAAINLGKAAHQANKAKQLGKTERPEYQIPQAQTEALNNAKYMASQTQLPGQNIMQQKIDQGSAGALSSLKDVSQNGSALGANIANIYRSNVGGQNQLNLAAAQNFNNNQSNLRGQLNTMSNFQDKQFEINKMQPYQNNMAASAALREGAFRNLSAGASDIASMGAGYANMKYWNGKLNPQIDTNGGTKSGFATEVNSNPASLNSFNIPVKTNGMGGVTGGYQYNDPNNINNSQGMFMRDSKDSPYGTNFNYQTLQNGGSQSNNTMGNIDMETLQRMIKMFKNPNSAYID